MNIWLGHQKVTLKVICQNFLNKIVWEFMHYFTFPKQFGNSSETEWNFYSPILILTVIRNLR
jgi:hypothetical protein